MSPSQLLSQVGELVGSGQHQAALQFVARHAADVAPPLNAQERTDVPNFDTRFGPR